MKAPRLLLAATLAATGLGTGPAHAGNQQTYGITVGPYGIIISRWSPILSLAAASAPLAELESICQFETVPAGIGSRLVELQGVANVTSLQPDQTVTFVECEVNNFAAGGENVLYASATGSGPTAVASNSASGWPSLPITVCVRSSATVGSESVTNPRVCRPPGITADPGGDCTVNLGSCHPGNSCTVNVGSCRDGGACTVNMSDCSTGGVCTVNGDLPVVSHPARCSDSGSCTINLGDCYNGDDALICFNATCDGTIATSEGYTGFTCGLATAQVDPQNPKKFDSTLSGGPWIVTTNDPVGNTISDVTVTCTVQINQEKHGGTGVARSNTTAGNVGTLNDTVSYLAQPTDKIYICSKYEWNSTKGHSTVFFDIDNDASDGLDCEWVNDGDPFPDN